MRSPDEGVGTSIKGGAVDGDTRRPYNAPFVRNLDAVETNGKVAVVEKESWSGSYFEPGDGPS